MSAALTLTGTLTIGEGCAGIGGCAGANGNLSIALALSQCSKSAAASVYVPSRLVSSPSAFVTLGEIGATATVKQGDTFFLQTNAPIELRLTNDDGAGGTTVQIVQVAGLFFCEFPAAKPLELVEVKGSATVMYVASGSS